MKRFLNKIFGGRKWYEMYIEAYFEHDGVLCPQCDRVLPADELEPLSFIPCPSCAYSLFIPLQLNDFLLFEPAGAGGMASVYKAYHRNRVSEVFAVKVLAAAHRHDPEAVAAFKLESEMHRRVPPHPYIVPFVEAGDAGNHQYYYSMEYVFGDRLVRRLEEKGKLPEREALTILAQSLEALIHIRDAGVLYRDVNAANIILDSNGDTHLLDFGLSLPLEDAAQDKGSVQHVEGTVEYMPPERLLGKGEDEVSVIYSLGLLFFYMLTGELLVKGKTLKGTAARHVSKLRLAHASTSIDHASDASVAILEQMVQPERSNRFAGFDAALEAVRESVAELTS